MFQDDWKGNDPSMCRVSRWNAGWSEAMAGDVEEAATVYWEAKAIVEECVHEMHQGT